MDEHSGVEGGAVSYCREGEDSDFYVYTDGETINCHGPDVSAYFAVEDKQQVIDWLMDQVRLGLLVPVRVFERLSAERDGLHYETDVERGMREMEGLDVGPFTVREIDT